MQATYLLGLLMDSYPLHSASILIMDKKRSPVVYASRGLSQSFIKEMYAKGTLPVVGAAFSGECDPHGGRSAAFGPRLAARARVQGPLRRPVPPPGKDPRLLHRRVPGARPDRHRDPGSVRGLRPDGAPSCSPWKASAVKSTASRNLDSLTGVYNFRVFHEVLDREFTRARKIRQARFPHVHQGPPHAGDERCLRPRRRGPGADRPCGDDQGEAPGSRFHRPVGVLLLRRDARDCRRRRRRPRPRGSWRGWNAMPTEGRKVSSRSPSG